MQLSGHSPVTFSPFFHVFLPDVLWSFGSPVEGPASLISFWKNWGGHSLPLQLIAPLRRWPREGIRELIGRIPILAIPFAPFFVLACSPDGPIYRMSGYVGISYQSEIYPLYWEGFVCASSRNLHEQHTSTNTQGGPKIRHVHIIDHNAGRYSR